MTALPTTVGETNTQPWVSKRHSASHGFGAFAAGARSSPRTDPRCRNNSAATTTTDRLRIRPPEKCDAIVFYFLTAQRSPRLLRPHWPALRLASAIEFAET